MNREDIKVAIIDDEEIIRRNLSSWLEDYDYEVCEANSGTSAIESEECITSQVAIVDMRMDGLNGNQTILALHKINSNMKFILHTGSTDYNIPLELRDIGITDEYIIFKPVLQMVRFCEKIDTLMDVGE